MKGVILAYYLNTCNFLRVEICFSFSICSRDMEGCFVWAYYGMFATLLINLLPRPCLVHMIVLFLIKTLTNFLDSMQDEEKVNEASLLFET